MTTEQRETLSKVPAVTLVFWIIKILATTLGETGGDSFTMSFLGETTDHPNPNGYLIGTAIFAVVFFISVAVQIRAKRFHPFIYWFTIIATTTVGTTLADYVTRSVGLVTRAVRRCSFSLYWHRCSFGTERWGRCRSRR